jgi:hypothetical protein
MKNGSVFLYKQLNCFTLCQLLWPTKNLIGQESLKG